MDLYRRLCYATLGNADMVHQRLTLPASFRNFLWNPNDPDGGISMFRVSDKHGGSWDFRWRLRFDILAGELVPEVSGDGWRLFLGEKSLRVEDKLVFYTHPDLHGVHFMVTVMRRQSLSLFGTEAITFADEE